MNRTDIELNARKAALQSQKRMNCARMNCAFCGSCGKMSVTSEVMTTKKLHFCGESCAYAYIRDYTRESIECSIQINKKNYEEDDKKCIPLSKFFKVRILFYQSCLQRKPRAELLKLQDLRKRIIRDLIEIAHADRSDQITFVLGETFKEDWKWLIDAWCR